MTFAQYRFLVLSDLYRYGGAKGRGAFWRFLLSGGSYSYTFWMRSAAYTQSHRLWRYLLYPLVRVMRSYYTYKLGISIPATTSIGSGFYIGHFGGIVINKRCSIGKNCNISQGVTLGCANRGARRGVPTIGENVYIAPGVKIVGRVKIGDNVALGANCVVTKDIPDNAVAVGIPAKVISFEGSRGYINFVDYP